MEFTNTPIQDPIWGAIHLTAVEERLLETPAFWRLQHVKQMGFAFLDYPGLQHTRFEHSVGVMHVADRMFMSLKRTSEGHDDFQKSGVFSEQKRQAVRLAALMHDLGHPPFSHAIELTFIRYPSLLEKAREECSDELQNKVLMSYSHERFTEYIINHDPDITAIIKDHFGADVTREELAGLAVGKAETLLSPFNQIISGDFDADKTDYLIRDNHYSGFKLGFTPDEVSNSLHLRRKEHGFELYVDRNAIPFVNSILTARDNLVKRVHLAQHGRAATQMLVGSLFEDLSSYSAKELLKFIFQMHRVSNDFTFFEVIASRVNVKHKKNIMDWFLATAGYIKPGASSKRDYNKEKLVPLTEIISAGKVWPQYGQLNYAKMHPCVRLLVYISARHPFSSLHEHLFQLNDNQDAIIWVEPSTRPAPQYSLLVDLDCNPTTPSMDYIAGTENQTARATLSSTLSNLHIFGYQYQSHSHSVNTIKLDSAATEHDYLSNLTRSEEIFLAKAAIQMAKMVKETYHLEFETKKKMLPTEFLLLLYYCLDKHLVETFSQSTNRYIYRGEYFINRFMRRLSQDEIVVFPDLFKTKDGKDININRIFNDIERLEVFGLLESINHSIYHSKDDLVNCDTRRTRHSVYGVRKDRRISLLGKHYVEHEVYDKELEYIRMAINQCQNNKAIIEKLGTIGVTSRNMRNYATPDVKKFSLESITKYQLKIEAAAEVILSEGGCVMNFSLPEKPKSTG